MAKYEYNGVHYQAWASLQHTKQISWLNTAIMREEFEQDYIAEDNPPEGISKPRWSAMLKWFRKYIERI